MLYIERSELSKRMNFPLIDKIYQDTARWWCEACLPVSKLKQAKQSIKIDWQSVCCSKCGVDS
jgi:hypothetical protein